MTFLYEGLILTTIKLDQSRENLKDDDEVSFTNASENAELDEAAFLKEIEKKGDKFIAKYVSKKKAAEFANNDNNKDRVKLFCVHGCCGSPEGILDKAHKAKTGDNGFDRKGEKNKCLPIPVLWPTRGFSSFLSDFFPGYTADFQTFAPDAGGILANLVNDIGNGSFGKVSLLCHSMGNHLVFNNAGLQNSESSSPFVAPDVKFENIFMVAADVPSDIFSPKPMQTNDEFDFGEKKQKAENLKNMLVEGGKIYVLHRDDDRLLQASVGAKWFRKDLPRLGTTGAYDILPKFDGTVINYNTKPGFDVIRFAVDTVRDITNHQYQYESKFVDFYNFVHGKKEDQTQEQFDDQVREKYDLTPPKVVPTVDPTEDEGSN